VLTKFIIINNCQLFLKNNEKLILKFQNKIQIKISNFIELFADNNIKNNSILIFEPNAYHFECTPGYTKYFIELGYNVDILMHKYGIDTFSLYEETENIRLFVFENINFIHKYSKILSFAIKKYHLIILQTADINNKDLFNKLDLLSINNSFFVFHNLEGTENPIYSQYYNKSRIWTVGNFSKGLQVNPHYFGNIRIKNKNKKTRFFMTSSISRNYKYLFSSFEKLKREKYNFEIIVTGWVKSNKLEKIAKTMKDIFQIKYKVSYNELYTIVKSCDYIIIPFDIFKSFSIRYKTTKSTGSIQLSYGFLKPIIINENYSEIYNLNDKNSLIYKNYSDLYNVIKKAILLSNKDYKSLENNLYISAKEIYEFSINNIKKSIKNF
jgi:hypothetical protein